MTTFGMVRSPNADAMKQSEYRFSRLRGTIPLDNQGYELNGLYSTKSTWCFGVLAVRFPGHSSKTHQVSLTDE